MMERRQRTRIKEATAMPEISVLESLFEVEKVPISGIEDGEVEGGVCEGEVDVDVDCIWFSGRSVAWWTIWIIGA